MEKLPIGPHKPYPGPTFPIHVMTDVMVVSKSKLLKECHDYGAMTDVSVMKNNYDTDIKNDFIMNGTILVVFTILSITGLIGFNGIQSAKHALHRNQ